MTENTPLALQPPAAHIKIRPVRLSDTDALRESVWPERSPDHVYRFIARIRQTASQGHGIGVVVVDDALIVGYGQFMLWPRCGEISDLIVAADQRGQGIGTAIIQFLSRAACDMHAECIDIGAAMSNPGAIALYRRLGLRDSFTQSLDLGTGEEPVLYLRLKLRR